MSDTKSLDAKKAILKSLNTMINAHKEYYESMKFKLIIDPKFKKKARLPKSNKKTNMKLNEADFEFKLPCHLIHAAFEESQYTFLRRFKNLKENYSFIRKLIKQSKIYFIQSVDEQNRKIERKECKSNDDLLEFSSNIIDGLLSDVVNESHEEINANQSSVLVPEQYEIFADNLVNELFRDLKLSVLQNQLDPTAQKPSELISNDETEENDTLDDMSSLNSSVGSNCHHLFVHNFLVKRRHSADIVRTGGKGVIHDTSWDNKNLLDISNRYVRRSSLQEADSFPENSKRRHSVNTISIPILNSIPSNETSITNDSDDMEINESSKNLNIQDRKLNVNRYKFKQHDKIIMTKQLRGVLRKLFGNINDRKVPEIISAQTREKKVQKNCQNIEFVDNFYEQVWADSMETIKETAKNIETNFVNILLENTFNEAFNDIQIINQSISKQQRLYFRCECTKQTSNNNSKYVNNINCLLSVYCMMIALSEFNLKNQITFICCHFA